MIAIGDSLPAAPVFKLGVDGPEETSIAAEAGDGTAILIGVPGAFTGTCSKSHVPGFIRHAPELQAAGAHRLLLVAVNDVFVLRAWAASLEGSQAITMISDGTAALAHATGLAINLDARSFGWRNTRYATIIRAGRIAWLAVEPNPGAVSVSGAEPTLAALRQLAA